MNPLGFRSKPSHNNSISEYQPAKRTGGYKTSSLGESLYSLLCSRTAVNSPHHSASQFSKIFFFVVVYFNNFSFLIIYFGSLGELHVDNRCQTRQPPKLKLCIHPEQRFSTSNSRVNSPTVPQLHFSILNLQIPLRYLDVKYSPSSISPAC